MQYDFKQIEQRWQRHWQENDVFAAANPGDENFDPRRPKYFVLDMFPYPSGVGLHVGHPLGYIATDIVARYKRMRGFNVLHPMGYDAFGLPAEQFAVEHNVHPRVTTERNIDNMTRQLKRLGLSYDWNRELATTDPDYYHWTQWIFVQLFNSWFDPRRNAARPIAELEQDLASETLYVGPYGDLIDSPAEGLDAVEGAPIGARKWHELAPDERREILDAHRLAYIDEVPVNWCPKLGTVLANEEVTTDGRSERGNHPVHQRPLRQWMLRITAYADRLIEDLDRVDWPDAIKAMQRNWIGRSEGAEVEFALADDPEDSISVFTTRPETLFGATYMVLAPEHPQVDDFTTDPQREAVAAYRKQAAAKTDLERQAEGQAKTGVFTGGYAINPVNGESLPVWIADYVLTGYGTGAIMAVPAHDDRDHAFARAHDLPIREVVQSPDDHDVQEKAWTGDGKAVNSANDDICLDGMTTADAKAAITDYLEETGTGRRRINYKLRDWLFSRQRYWGEPFPVLHGPNGEIETVDPDDLPVELPPMDDFKPEASDDPDQPPRPPLARAPESWRQVERDGETWTRELNTMPQWAGSCWYYLRFCDPHNDDRLVGEEAERYWMNPTPDQSADEGGLRQAPMGVDLYVGGVEHAVLHLLYARFWHKVLYDLGHVST
ncbi:MAG: class I tRNA ligase family protein, partial [Phycisphaeraceae bacterium]|nr:class I tRNA ligase family protein [Phycisphaeraceae bacterium]